MKSILSATRKDKGSSQKYPLLDAHWCSNTVYLKFYFPKPGATNSELNNWNSQVSSLIAAYSQLLLEDFDKFWCEIIYSHTLHDSLDSVLQAKLRIQDLPKTLLRFASLLCQLKTLTLLVFQRASKPKHSDTLFLTDSDYARLLHDKFVFDPYRFITLTLMYCTDNRETITEIIRSVVTVQPKFIDDISGTLNIVLTILRNIEQELQQWQFEEDHGTEKSSDVNCFDRLDNVIDYLLDVGTTLDQFLSILSASCPEVPKKFIADGLHIRFAHYCDSLTDLIRGQVLRNMRWSYEQKTKLLRKLSSAITAMVKTVRCGMVEPGLLSPITQLAFSDDASKKSKKQELSTAVDDFLQHLTEFSNHRNFACFYSLLYAIDEDINSIREMTPSDVIDPNVLEYVRGVYSTLALDMKSQQANAVRTEIVPPPVSTLLRPKSAENTEEPQAGPSRSTAFCTVKTVLPDVADDLIQRCLEHYKDDCQAVISALLEGTVPLEVSNPKEARQQLEEQARIQRRQRTGPRQDDEISTMNLAAAAATGVVHLKRDQIWQGKRQGAGGPELEPLSAQDRERVKEMAVSVWDDEDDQDAWWRIDAPGRAGGPKRFEDVNCDPYDDEYDDTYDLDVGATEHLTTDTDLVPPPRSVEEVEENDGEEEELGSDDEGKPEQHNGQSDSSFGKPGRGRNPRERGGRGRQTEPTRPPHAPTAVASTRARGTSVHFERIVRHASNLVGSQQLPSVKSRPQQHQGPNLLSDDRKDLRLSQKGPINSPDIGDEDNEQVPTQKNTLHLEDPAIIRARREAIAEAKAFRKGRVVRTQPTDVPPQPLPKDAEFFPTTPEPRQPWYAGPSNRPGQQPRRGSGGDRGRSRAGRGGGFSRSSAGAPDPAGNYETESSSNTKQQAAARRLTPPPKAPASTLARRGGITPYQAKLKERYGGHNQRTLADRKRQL